MIISYHIIRVFRGAKAHHRSVLWHEQSQGALFHLRYAVALAAIVLVTMACYLSISSTLSYASDYRSQLLWSSMRLTASRLSQLDTLNLVRSPLSFPFLPLI